MQMEMELITLKGRYHLGMSHTSTGIIEPLLDSMDFMEISLNKGSVTYFWPGDLRIKVF